MITLFSIFEAHDLVAKFGDIETHCLRCGFWSENFLGKRLFALTVAKTEILLLGKLFVKFAYCRKVFYHLAARHAVSEVVQRCVHLSVAGVESKTCLGVAALLVLCRKLAFENLGIISVRFSNISLGSFFSRIATSVTKRSCADSNSFRSLKLQLIWSIFRHKSRRTSAIWMRSPERIFSW